MCVCRRFLHFLTIFHNMFHGFQSFFIRSTVHIYDIIIFLMLFHIQFNFRMDIIWVFGWVVEWKEIGRNCLGVENKSIKTYFVKRPQDVFWWLECSYQRPSSDLWRTGEGPLPPLQGRWSWVVIFQGRWWLLQGKRKVEGVQRTLYCPPMSF